MTDPLDLEGAPPAALALLDSLGRQGLVLESRWDQGRLNQVSTFRDPSTSIVVHLGADRGQWYVDLGLSAERCYTIDLWEACLAGRPASLDVVEMAEQVKMLERIWPAVVTAPVTIGECLEAEGLRVVMARTAPPEP